ncbi:MAG: TIGR04255 family protein [Sedimentisphaerales bacterium]|nr:TIGR04255 family protein [Sedimentisphaerales bacterium]
MRKRYKKTFLKNVIIRVDFAFPVEKLQKTLPTSVSTLLLKSFPISEPKKTIAGELKITPEETKEKHSLETHWFYYGKDRQKKACLAPEFFWITYESYSSFEDLKKEFVPILEQLCKNFKDLQVNRFGLRYINHIVFNENNIFEWSKYLKEDLLLLPINLATDKKQIIRLFNNSN